MRILLSLIVVLASPPLATAQRMQEREEEFLKSKPHLNEPLPDVSVFSADGKEFKTSNLRGQYSVLTFGCLT